MNATGYDWRTGLAHWTPRGGGARPELGDRVRVYRNLHRAGLSIQTRTPSGWRVAGYVDRGAIRLTEARLVMRDHGRLRAQLEGRKNVHAWIEGTVAEGHAPPEARPTAYTIESGWHYRDTYEPAEQGPGLAVLAMADGAGWVRVWSW